MMQPLWRDSMLGSSARVSSTTAVRLTAYSSRMRSGGMHWKRSM